MPVTLRSFTAGDRLEENRSRFKACGGPCRSPADIAALLSELSTLYRLRKASQTSWAARFQAVEGKLLEVAEDGGESGVARCILEVMRAMDAVDCLVLIARWYGGKHLGGMRFRIYRTLTGQLLSVAVPGPPVSAEPSRMEH